jgi:Holliday junction resolvase RusA-like endonuclease
MIKFTVGGKPKTLKRHRDRKGGRGKYDPSKSDKDVFVMHCNHKRPKEPFDFPLHVYLQFHFLNHKSEPDIDNCIKFVFDALNGIFWKDDRYIERVTAVKVFNGNPRTEIIIMEVDQEIKKS